MITWFCDYGAFEMITPRIQLLRYLRKCNFFQRWVVIDRSFQLWYTQNGEIGFFGAKSNFGL